MIDLPSVGCARRSVTRVYNVCPARAGVCTNVTSFDLEVTEDTRVDTERPPPVPKVTVGSNPGLPASTVPAQATW